MSKSLDEIREMFEKAYAMSTTPEIKLVPEGYIFDEEQSVRWNREEVKRHNDRICTERDKLLDAKHKAISLAQQSLLDYIQEENQSGFSKKQVEMIYSYLYDRYHHCWSDLMASVDETIDMFDHFILLGEYK